MLEVKKVCFSVRLTAVIFLTLFGVASSGKGKSSRSVVPCSSSEFRCARSGRCISGDLRCDGVKACSDNSDEQDCGTVVNTKNEEDNCSDSYLFKCKNGKCISAKWLCDGVVQCGLDDDGDNSDELNCDQGPREKRPDTTSSNNTNACGDETTWPCHSGQCIMKSWLCDGQPDCVDQSDEPPGCASTHECPGEFKCANGQCTKRNWICDGKEDCKDGSDELGCTAAIECPKEDGKFLCKSGQCINASLVCNQKNDCTDSTDEFRDCASACNKTTCEHACLPTGDSTQPGFCYCKEGYTISGPEKSRCADINECQIFGLCSQSCQNSVGGFQCGCIDGFQLDFSNRTCVPIDSNVILVFGMKGSIRKYAIEQKEYTSFIEHSGTHVGVAYDAPNQYIYWSDVLNNQEAIFRAKFDGTGIETIVDTGLILPEGIAYDWIANNIYFTDSNNSHIGVCNSEGTKCAVLVAENMDKPRDIAVNPNLGIMFWTDWGDMAAIIRAGMDGSTPLPIVSTNLRWPNGITVDHGTARIYWNDANSDTIETANFQGEDRQVVRSTGMKHPFGIEVFGDLLIWSDWTLGEIQSCNKFTGKDHTVFVKEPGNLVNGLVVAHPANQPKLRANHCANAKCSHICTLTPSKSYRCQCPVGMRLSSKDRKTCKDDSTKAKLLIVHNNILKTFRFGSIGRKLLDQYALDTVQMIGSAVYNPLNDTVILSDSYTKKIYQYDLRTKTLELIVQRHIDAIKGMDIDIVGQNLYWADTMRKTVEVMSLRTKARFIILRETDRPMDLVLVPEMKLMFVAQVGQRGGKILKMNMNGYNRGVLIRIPNGEPTALTYNRDMGHIFWVDAIQRTIEHVSIDGRSYFGTTSSSGAPYGITSYKDKIFWSDRYTQELRSSLVGTNRLSPPIFIGDQEMPHNSTKESYLEGNFFAQISIMSNDSSYAKELLNNHDCSRNLTTGCSHICLISGDDNIGTCVCPDGLQLNADMKTCSEQKTCFETQFSCIDGRCISDDWKCDGTIDCETGEDEKDCETLKPCRKSDFVCESDKICVPGHWRCDGEHDCKDGSDEKNCTLKPCTTDSDFRCESGRCIPQSWRCDHQVDCPDSSDEKNCNFTCPPNYFTCNGSLFNCISMDWVCDGEWDCYDGSDEHANCKSECGSNDFKCFNQKCVSKDKLCNGKDDCGDNSDESQCNSTVVVFPRSSAISSVVEPTTLVSNRTALLRNDSRCAVNEYWCLSGECILLTKTCDTIKDCMDGSDEGPDCSKACKSSKDCLGQCYKTPRGSQCSCAAGLQLSEDKKSCEDINECAFNPCDHYCSNTKGSFKCTCHPAYALRSDYRTCKASGKLPQFLYEWDSRVYVAPQDLQSSISIEAKPGAISGMDVDSYGGYVYWSNAVRGIVSRLNIDPKIPSETLITSLVTPTVLTYDWIFNNLYVISYASSTRSTKKRLVLKVCTLRQDIPEKLCSVLFHIMGDDVTSIKVAPEYKFIFWTEIIYTPFARVDGVVRRGTIDGSEALTLAVDNVHEPKGLAIDHVRQRVLWADNVANTIEAVNFDGRNRQIIIPSGVHAAVSGLALFENWVMWNDKGKQVRCRIDMHSQCAHVSIKGNDITKNLNIIQQSLQPRAQNPCEKNNCSFICVPSLTTAFRSRNAIPYKCLCPDNYSALDAYSIHCIPSHQLKPVPREESAQSYDYDTGESLGDYHLGEDDDIHNSFGPHRIQVDGRRLEDTSNSSSGASTAGIVIGVMAVLVVVLVIIAVVLHRRNVHPKVLVRPYVQQWVKYVNEPVQRFFSDGNRPEPLNGDKHLYDEVYHSGGGTTYSNPGYEEIDGPNNLYTALDEFPKAQPRSFTDSGIMNSERNSMNEEDMDSHCISFSQTDRLIN